MIKTSKRQTPFSGGIALAPTIHQMSMLCYACHEPLLDDQPYARVFSADLPYRHTDPEHCPALREELEAEKAGKPASRRLRAV